MPRGRDALSLDELASLFGQLAALGSFRLGLTGGEPLLRRDLLEVIDAATDAGLHPCITTNGFFLTDALARELGRRSLVWLNVSLDGASAETNDAVRGAGTFACTMERLRSLAELARFTVAFTLTSQNAHEVEDCVALARSVGAHTAVFRPLYPTGAALTRLDLMPRFDMYRSALERLAALARQGDHVARMGRSLEPFGPGTRANTTARVTAGHGCGAANTVCSVSVDGRVSPCSFLGPKFESASIRERPFREIWDEGATFRQLRESAGEDFAGGCRARSLALEGSVHARDPWEVAWRAMAGEAVAVDETIEVEVDA
jgi:radical SAM protein with 4Fe4S-binding SPASM domain